MILTRISLFALVCFLANQTTMHAMLQEIDAGQTEINKSLIVYASRNDMAGVVKCLQHGAQVNAQNSEGQTALHCVIVGNSLASTPELDFFKDPGHIPCDGKDELIAFLIEQKADVNVVDRSLQTPMHYAAHYDRTHALELLKNAGGDLNAQNNVGSTPCHRAVDDNRLRAIAWLAKAGADMNWIDSTGMAPLHEAVHCERLPVIRQLLAHGTRLDIRTGKNVIENVPESAIMPAGSTVFHLAATPNKNSAAIQRLLLSHALFHPERSSIGKKEFITFLCCFWKSSPAAYAQRNTIFEPLMPYLAQSLSPQLFVGFLASNNQNARSVTRNILTDRLLMLKTLVAAPDENGDTAYQVESRTKVFKRNNYPQPLVLARVLYPDTSPQTVLLATLYDEQLQQFITSAQENTIAMLDDFNVVKVAYDAACEQQQPPTLSFVDSLKASSTWIQEIIQQCTVC